MVIYKFYESYIDKKPTEITCCLESRIIGVGKSILLGFEGVKRKALVHRISIDNGDSITIIHVEVFIDYKQQF